MEGAGDSTDLFEFGLLLLEEGVGPFDDDEAVSVADAKGFHLS
jgi:hypothetical protein